MEICSARDSRTTNQDSEELTGAKWDLPVQSVFLPCVGLGEEIYARGGEGEFGFEAKAHQERMSSVGCAGWREGLFPPWVRERQAGR